VDPTIVEWLGTLSSTVFAWSLGAFLVINGAAAVVFMFRRDRGLVNRWTGRILAADLLLVGTGLGVPVVASMAKLTVAAVSSSFAGSRMSTELPLDAGATELTPAMRR